MKIPYCLVAYRLFGPSRMDTFSGLVKTGIYSNPTVFTAPPVTELDFDDSRAKFNTAASEYKQYGAIKKTIFTTMRTDLVGKLNLNAIYVNKVANGDASTILLSGFTPSRVISQRAQPIDRIMTFEVTQTKGPGRVDIEIPTINGRGDVTYNCFCVAGAKLKNAVVVDGQIILSADDPQIHQDYNKSRKKTFQNLTEGVQYFFYVSATNSAGVSPLSEPISMWVS